MIAALFSKKIEERADEKLRLALLDPKSEISKRVDSKAAIMAGVLVMRWLDAKRIRHCAVCPSTDTLRKQGNKFICPQHMGMVVSTNV